MIAVAAALGMVLTRRAVHCAVLLAIVMLILAAMYAMQGAPFLAFVQVIVYTGAVLMLFLFVMMIVGVSAADSLIETIRGQRFWAGLAAIGSLVLVGLVAGLVTIGPAAPAGSRNGSLNVNNLAALIHQYVFPFEATSALLIRRRSGVVLACRSGSGPRRPSGRCPAAGSPAAGRRRFLALAPTRCTTRWTRPRCCPTARSLGCR